MQRQVPLHVEQQGLREAMIGSHPISLNQKRLWDFYEREPDSPLYNFPVGLRIVGPLDPGLLRRALNAIMARHEILRGTFARSNRIPLQITVQDRAVEMPLIDISGLTETVREAELARLANEEIRRPFNLSSDAMLRALLLRVGKADHVLVLTTNLIAVDVWSMGILLRELTDAYAAYSVGKVPVLPELPMQYADFAMWQNQWLQGEVLESRLSFWKQQLAGMGSIHHLPADFPRMPMQTHRGAREVVVLPESLAGSLKVLSQLERVSLFMTLLAAFQGLLHHYSGHDNIVVGTCAANRNRLETEGVIGLFANDLILRTDLSGNPTFRELLGRVRLTTLTAYTYQDIPIGKLAEELQPGRDLSRHPLFQAMFILQDDPTENLQIPGLTLSRYKLHAGTAEFDLMMLIERRKGLEVTLEYNTDLFEAATIKRMLEHYRTTLEVLTNDPNMSVAKAPIRKEVESRQITLGAVSRDPDVQIADLQTQPEKAQSKQLGPSLEEGFATPTDDFELRLSRIWESLFGIRPINRRQNFFELGGNSLMAARMLTRAEQDFGKKLSLFSLYEAPTIEQLAVTMRIQNSAPRLPRLVTIQSEGSRPPFLILGAGPLWQPLAKHLGHDQPFRGLSLDLSDAHLKLPFEIEEIARYVVRAIRDGQLQGPYFLGGYCGRGVLAYEVAQQLRAEGQQVALLVLLNSPNVGCWGKYSKLQRFYAQFQFSYQDLRRQGVRRMPRHILSRLTGKIKWRRGRKSSDRGSPLEDHSAGNLDRIVNEAAMAYRPRPYHGPVMIVRSAKFRGEILRDQQLGWADFFTGWSQVHELPGDHRELLRQPNVVILAERLRTCLREAQGQEKECMRVVTSASERQ